MHCISSTINGTVIGKEIDRTAAPHIDLGNIHVATVAC